MKWFLRLSNPLALSALPEHGFHFWDVERGRVLSSDDCMGVGALCEEMIQLITNYAWRVSEPMLIIDETDGYVIVTDHPFTTNHLENFYGNSLQLTSIQSVSYSKANLVKWLDEGNLDHIKLRALRGNLTGLVVMANFASTTLVYPPKNQYGIFYPQNLPDNYLCHYTKMFFEHETDAVVSKMMWEEQSDMLSINAKGHYTLSSGVIFSTGVLSISNVSPSYLTHQFELFTDPPHNAIEDSYETPYLAYIL